MKASGRQRREYSDEVKAACVAAIFAGQAFAAVAAQFNVPTATLRSWKARALAGGAGPLVSEDVRARIGELLVGYLAEAIEALRKQAVVAGDGEYLKKQSAGELAALHGEFADRALRILEALEQDADEGPEGGVGGVPAVPGVLPGAVGAGL
jgi:transposase-like protein